MYDIIIKNKMVKNERRIAVLPENSASNTVAELAEERQIATRSVPRPDALMATTRAMTKRPKATFTPKESS